MTDWVSVPKDKMYAVAEWLRTAGTVGIDAAYQSGPLVGQQTPNSKSLLALADELHAISAAPLATELVSVPKLNREQIESLRESLLENNPPWVALDDINALCDMAAAPLAATEWRPIATAPRDGTKMLVLTPNGDIEVSEFYEIKSYIYEPVEGTEYHRQVLTTEHSGWNASTDPTHWMPLPPLPGKEE